MMQNPLPILLIALNNNNNSYKKAIDMPGFDRTGPEGQGARTGRQMGKCSNNDSFDNEKAKLFESEARKSMRRDMGRGVGNAAGRAGRGKGAGRGSRGRQGGSSWRN
jgi:hypothetical protein